MKSMTGYAYKESSGGNIMVSVEIRGYNNRFLDLSIHLPSWLSSLEMRVRESISSRFARGKMELGIRIREENAPVSVSINESAALNYKKAIQDLEKAGSEIEWAREELEDIRGY